MKRVGGRGGESGGVRGGSRGGFSRGGGRGGSVSRGGAAGAGANFSRGGGRGGSGSFSRGGRGGRGGGFSKDGDNKTNFKKRAIDGGRDGGAPPAKKKKTAPVFNFTGGKVQEYDLKADQKIKKDKETEEEEGEDVEMENGEEGGETKPKLTPEEKKLAARKEQKKKQDERRAMRPHSDLLKEAKTLWCKVISKKLSKEERAVQLSKLMRLIDGKVYEITFKHDASRIVQACVKFGSVEQRQKIINELKEHFVPLAKSRFGHHLLKKIFKYAQKKQVPELMKPLKGQLRGLLKHKEAATVVEYLYTDICTSAQRTAMVQEFYGPEFALFSTGDTRNLDTILKEEPTKKASILRHLKETAEGLINKGLLHHSIIHRLFLDYISHSEPKNTLDLISNLKERLPEILHTREGARVAVHCLSYAPVKDRKAIVKALKGLVKKICLEEYGHTVILRALDVIDDTVLSKKGILNEIITDLLEIVLDKHGRLVLLHILNPRNTRYFNAEVINQLQPAFLPGENGEEVPTSKKSADSRRQELLSGISEPLLKLCSSETEKLIISPQGRDVFFETIKEAKGKKDPVIQSLLSLISTEEIDSSLLCHAIGHRVIKRMVHESTTCKLDDGTEFAIALLNSIEKRITAFAVKKNASFVIVSLLEHEPTKAKSTTLLKKSLKVDEKKNELDAGTKLILQTLRGEKTTTPAAAAGKTGAKAATGKEEKKEEQKEEKKEKKAGVKRSIPSTPKGTTTKTPTQPSPAPAAKKRRMTKS